MGDTGFKHIAVTAADEDDEVITAGVKPSAQEAAESGVRDELAGDVQVAGDEGDNGDGDEAGAVAGAVASAETPVERAAAAGPQKLAKGASDARSARKQGEYRESALSDLEPEPMSMTQKVVIIAAVVCIIGALIYYFAFMR